MFSDIDGIKIKYDAEGGATKRSYNYRVGSRLLACIDAFGVTLSFLARRLS